MKPRRVLLTFEVETDEPLKKLRDKDNWRGLHQIKVLQMQANVVRKKK